MIPLKDWTARDWICFLLGVLGAILICFFYTVLLYSQIDYIGR